MSAQISVLIVDDSALIRQILTEIINNQPDMCVVGAASDPFIAREKIKSLNPDVVTLDVEMPKMDGLAFLERLMRLRPMPVVMISSLTERNAAVTLRALELGAIDFVTKPRLGINEGLRGFSEVIADKIRAAARARLPQAGLQAPPPSAAKAVGRTGGGASATERIIAIGASTGGTEAIREILSRMPADSPPILVTQHMPEGFTRTFAERMNELCSISVKEAEGGEVAEAGCAYVAPGHSHLLLKREGRRYMLALDQGPPVNRHRPSVDVLFQSVSEAAGRHAIGVILTGMGGDGAQGMLEMRRSGAFTIAQDEASCVIFGMPRMAIEAGGVNQVLPLQDIPEMLRSLRSEPGRKGAR